MKYLHTMIKISDIEKSLNFYCKGLSLIETRRIENKNSRFTLIFLAAAGDEKAELKLTYNWDGDMLGDGSRNSGHVAYCVENFYQTCKRLKDMIFTINRPPRDGHIVFVRFLDNISIENLQEKNLEIKESWVSMKNSCVW